MAGQNVLQADAFKKLYPEQYFEKFAQERLRPDGRALTICRPVTIGLHAAGSADGSALIKIGTTTVLAGSRLEVMVPSTSAPDQGQLVINIEVTPLSSADYRPGRPPQVSYTLTQQLTNVLLGSGVFDLTQLCIAAGQAVWVLYLDLYILDDSGSLLDAALLASVAALLDTRIPAVHVTSEGNVERDDPEYLANAGVTLSPLTLNSIPMCLTCGLYKDLLIPDPDHEEALLMSDTVSVVLDQHSQLLGK